LKAPARGSGYRVADQVPGKKHVPPFGTMERYRAIEWFTFIGTEVHTSFSPLFNPAVPEEAKAVFRKKVLDRLTWVDSQLAGRDYLMGASFSVPDAYLFATARWSPFVGVDITGLANLNAFLARMAARPAVHEAMKAEGLLK
jgi:glutathione S-transferase